MAAIIKRGKSYCVVYKYTEHDGNRKQKWETYKTMADAIKRRTEVEYKENLGTFIVPKCNTLNDLLDEYISLYGKNKWAMSTYQSNTSIINNYIRPKIGSMALSKITTRVVERFYQELLKTKPVKNNGRISKKTFLSPTLVRNIHKILRSCFAQAVKWEMLERNPCEKADVPKATPAKREIWTAETMFQALDVCENDLLALAINLSFSCSLRIGEILGLTWDCIDITPESITAGSANVYIEKELQRVSRSVMKTLDKKDIILTFPASSSKTKTILVLKTPKTESSIRKVFLPKTVAEMLVSLKNSQEENKEVLGDEYRDFNLVFGGAFGLPTEISTITGAFQRLIKDNDLPPVVFHSFRHSSITYKLKLNGGDIKAVQGDSGHAQTKMVTDVYSHILDEDRKSNAQLFEETFYTKTKPCSESATEANIPNESNQEILLKLLANSEMATLLKTLAKNL